MMIYDYFFIVMSLIAGFSTYCFIVGLLNPIPNAVSRIEKFMANSASILGLIGTFLGFYFIVKHNLDQDSIVSALKTALPTTIAGLGTTLFCTLLITISPREKSKEADHGK